MFSFPLMKIQLKLDESCNMHQQPYLSIMMNFECHINVHRFLDNIMNVQ